MNSIKLNHKKLFFLVIFNIICIQISFSQINLKKHTRYTDKVRSYITSLDFEKAKQFSDSAMLAIHPKSDSISYTLLTRSIIFDLIGNLDSCKHFLRLSENLIDSTEQLAATLYQLKGFISEREGKYLESIDYFSKELNLLKKYKQSKNRIASSMINQASAKMFAGQYKQAINSFNNAIELAKKIPDSTTVVKGLINKGLCYSYLKNHTKSARIQEEALNISKELKKDYLEYFCHTNLGSQYTMLHKYKKARKHLSICINHKKYDQNKSICLHTLGLIADYQKNYKEAIKIAEETIQFDKKNGNKTNLNKAKKQLASYLRKNKEYKKAQNVLQELLLELTDSDRYLEQYVHEEFISLEMDKLQLNSLTNHWDKYREIQDTLYKKEINDAIYNAEIKYKTAEKEIKNQQLINEQNLNKIIIQKQKIKIWSAITGVTLLGLISFLLYKQSKVRQEKNIILLKQKNQIEALHKDLAHRIKNNLFFVSTLMKLQASKIENSEAKLALLESESRIETISLLHRKLNTNTDNKDVELYEYLSEIFENLLFTFPFEEKKPKINFVSDKINLDGDIAMRIGLILNELITNSFKHAFHKTDKPQIEININHQGNGVYKICYMDNGSGIKSSINIDQKERMGLKLIHTLTKQLNGKFSNLESINGTKFEFLFNQKSA